MGLTKILKNHFRDTTAIMATANPLMSIVEIMPPNSMTDEGSINARIGATTMFYSGLGFLFSKGRDFSKKRFNISDESSERVKSLHDSLYGIAFGFGVSTIIYPVSSYLNGEQMSTYEVIKASSIAGLMSIPVGWSSGYSLDVFKDLVSGEKSSRVPDYISNQNPSLKKSLAVLIAAGSVALMTSIYNISGN